MASLLTQTIHVSPLVKKFLALHYETAPFRIGASRRVANPFAAFLLNALESYPCKIALKEYESLTDTLTIGVSLKQIEREYNCRHLSQRKAVQFNTFVRQTFMQMAVREMVVRVNTGESVTASARTILDRYGLSEDDLSLDTLTRYYRAYASSMSLGLGGAQKSAWLPRSAGR